MNSAPRFLQPIFFLFALQILCNTTALADWQSRNDELHKTNDSIGTEYYTIADPVDESPTDLMNPFSVIKDFQPQISKSQSEQNLLNWVFHELSRPEIPEKYKRKFHFGSWIKDPSQNSCLNVRGLVLMRDAQGPIQYADARQCRIVSSVWIDPYTNSQLTQADDVQIDHMVPLKNAYISGAWSWSAAQRCLYANYMGNQFHLLPVLGTENNRKSDSTPEKYIPPRKEYICKYLVHWLKIKSIWQLKLAKEEALAISEELKNYNCNISDFKMDREEWLQQRNHSVEYPEACARRNFDD